MDLRPVRLCKSRLLPLRLLKPNQPRPSRRIQSPLHILHRFPPLTHLPRRYLTLSDPPSTLLADREEEERKRDLDTEEHRSTFIGRGTRGGRYRAGGYWWINQER